MNLPLDPMMLLSVVNMNLRDRYPSLAEFCAAENVDQADLKNDWQPLIIIMKQTATSSADVRLLSRHEKRFVKPSQVSQTFYLVLLRLVNRLADVVAHIFLEFFFLEFFEFLR